MADELRRVRDALRPWLGWLAPHRGALALCLAFLLAGSAVALVLPLLAGDLAQAVLAFAGTGAVQSALIALLALVMLHAGLAAGGSWLLAALEEDVAADGRLAVYRHLQSLPLSFHLAREREDMHSLIERDAGAVSRALVQAAVALAPRLALTAASAIMMVRLDPVLGTAMLVALPLGIFAARLAAQRNAPLARSVRQLEAEGTLIAESHLRLLPLAKAFNAERQLERRFDDHRARIRFAAKRAAFVDATLGPLIRVLAAALVLAAIWLASERLASQQIGPGTLTSVILFGFLLLRPLGALADIRADSTGAFAAAARLRAVLDRPPETLAPAVSLGTGASRRPERRRGRTASVEFDGIRFGYRPLPVLLEDVSFSIGSGELVALTGARGAGKTTLVNLLLRHLEPLGGVIRLGGWPIDDGSIAELRRQVSVVPQECVFFPWTLGENLVLGDDAPDERRLWWALEQAGAQDIVFGLPQGLDSALGPGGVRLSAGQQQRLALARALYRPAPVLVLDEPNALFDARGEARFVERARQTLAERAILLITHRRDTLEIADRVLRLEGGRIVTRRPLGNVVRGPWGRPPRRRREDRRRIDE